MNGYGSHTFKLVNAHGNAVYCKFHWKTDQGIKNLTVDRAGQLASEDPDYAIRDLYNSIAEKKFPSWILKIQVMTFEQAEKFRWNPFDLTKIWPQGEFPLIPVGKMVLNRNPDNYFAQVEQVAFAPAHMVPGVEPSPDKMLQGRLFSYPDTHRHRLGPNYQQIPVNCPYAKVSNYQRDGFMTVNGNQEGAPNYFPNSFNGPNVVPETTWHTISVSGDVKKFNSADDDNFTQVGNFYRKVLSEAERARLTKNIAGHLAGAKEAIQKRAVANFAQADPDYGRRIEEELKKQKAKAKL